ncbi:uncharacterized protein LOC142334629 isoform X2 [Convolutriloba macropyga]|uniref:uncharacterized protein LOC142334629 isoform X2 n=1 Tax=Convolutriloba macropyga TaxID=536237 RepID=UPI003F5233EB
MSVLPSSVFADSDKITSARYGTASRLWAKRVDVSGKISNEVSSANAKCQKCLEKGHWTYQCKGKRKVLERVTRTKQYEQDMKRIRSGLPLGIKSNKSGNEYSKGEDDANESEALKQLKAALDAESSSDSDSDSDSSSSSSGSSSGSSDSGDSSSSSSSGETKRKRRKK